MALSGSYLHGFVSLLSLFVKNHRELACPIEVPRRKLEEKTPLRQQDDDANERCPQLHLVRGQKL